MANDNQGMLASAYDFVKQHWGELYAVGQIAYSVTKGSISEDADPATKAAAKTAGAKVGGEDSEKDEAGLTFIMRMVGEGYSPLMRKELKRYLQEFIITAYNLDHKERYERTRGETKLGKWRLKLMHLMNEHGQHVAAEYLTEVATDVRHTFLKELREKGKTMDTVKGAQKKACWQNTCRSVARRLHSEGITFPFEEPTPFMVHARRLLRSAPDRISAGKKWWSNDRNTARRRLARIKAKRASNNGWNATKETTTAHAAWMEEHAANRRTIDADRRWWKRCVDWLL